MLLLGDCVMMPLNGSSRYGSDAYYAPANGDELERWQAQRQDAAVANVRLPSVLAAQRINLASRRCDELREQIEELSDRLLNVPAHVSQGDVHAVEESKRRLEERLHKERLGLWQDLQPLAESARDGAIEALRAAWVNELSRVLGSGGGQ